MNVLLTTINSKYIHQNLAIRLLYELNKNEADLYMHEFTLRTPHDDIVDYCATFQMVAFSCYIWNITQTLEVAKKIKLRNPDCLILLGGPEVSFEWKDIIALNEIDFIITDEGEIPFSKLLTSFPALDAVPGLIWKKEGTVIENKTTELFDLNNLADINPYSSIPDEELNNKICYIEATRGCPHRCIYCLAGIQNKVRTIPAKAVEANLLYLMERGKTIKFLDRTFNANPRYAISIFEFILQHCRPANVFQFEIKADVPQPELIEFIQQHVPKGIFRFEIGIQTLNAKSNQEINRKLDFDNIKSFINQIQNKIEIHLDLIVGLPNDYLEDVKYSFEEVFKLFAPELQLGFLKFLKGTPIREHCAEHGYQFHPTPPYQIIESNYLSTQELDEISIVEDTLDLYWNKKRAVNTLKYIASTASIYDFLLGLGTYLQSKQSFNKVELSKIYTTLKEFTTINNPQNQLLIELIALDYYLQYKIKPSIRFLPELESFERTAIINNRGLNPQKFRYVIHPVNFNVEKFITDNIIEKADDVLIVEYNGTSKPRLIVR